MTEHLKALQEVENSAGGFELMGPGHHVSEWSRSGDSAANTAQTLTVAAVAGRSHFVTGYTVAISAAVAAGDIIVEVRDGGNRRWRDYIGNAAARGARIDKEFKHPLRITAGAALTLLVTAGGANCVTTANICGYTK